MKTLYTDIIMEACTINDLKEACLIEKVIRDEYRTLDHLSREKLIRLAREAQDLLKDPKWRELYGE